MLKNYTAHYISSLESYPYSVPNMSLSYYRLPYNLHAQHLFSSHGPQGQNCAVRINMLSSAVYLVERT